MPDMPEIPESLDNYPEEYTYPDPTLSVWQSAAETVSRQTSRALFTFADGAKSLKRRLNSPVHVVKRATDRLHEKVAPYGKDLENHLAYEAGLPFLDVGLAAGECAAKATQFLWAEMTKNKAKAHDIAQSLHKSVCDVPGWSECVSQYLKFKAHGGEFPYRSGLGTTRGLKDEDRIAIIGDWGTGEEEAVHVLNEIKRVGADVIMHLGDIYYAGTDQENRHNFLQICRGVLGADTPLYSLCGNHDMYSGGSGYYWLLDEIGQRTSFFSLQNDNWLFLAMDTGNQDHKPLTALNSMTGVYDSEVKWHLDQIDSRRSKKIILLSHHQLFSAFSSVGRVEGRKYAYNPNLSSAFSGVLDRVTAWFWGHEHNLAIYKPYMKLERGRCLGCSAIPVFGVQKPYAIDTSLLTSEPSLPEIKPFKISRTSGFYNHAFCIVNLDHRDALVQYFEVPWGGPASVLYEERI